jgi:hypothetical protein
MDRPTDRATMASKTYIGHLELANNKVTIRRTRPNSNSLPQHASVEARLYNKPADFLSAITFGDQSKSAAVRLTRTS